MTMVVFQIVGLVAAHNAAKGVDKEDGGNFTNFEIAENSDGGPLVGTK